MASLMMPFVITDRRVLARTLRHNGRTRRLVMIDRLGPFVSIHPFDGELHSTTYIAFPLLLIAAPGSPSATALLLDLS